MPGAAEPLGDGPGAPRAAQAAALALACLSLALQGCESEYERHLRWSCRWDPDRRLVGCAEPGFRECVGRCEFCLGGLGTDFEGRDDECAQLRCGAYCARRSGEACPGTYSRLCEAALEELAAAGRACAADCSAARRAAAPAAAAALAPAAAAAAALAAGARPEAAAAAAAALAAALLLQGCGSACPAAAPSLPEWAVDLARLDRAAGCQDEWNWLWGNPCASDVPVLFAKKGVERDADEDFIKGRVKNERHACVERAAGGYCQRWTSARDGCETQDLGLCACTGPSNGSRYCHSWQCIGKRASQNLCREDCCGDRCTPCVACGKHGTSPFPMSPSRFEELAAAERSPLGSLLGRPGALRAVRAGHWSSVDFQGECLAGRRVASPGEVPCTSWREVPTALASCTCRRASTGADYCQAWSCDERTGGMFSVLFAKDMPYDDLIEGADPERYECIEAVRLAGGEARCRAWQGEMSRYEKVSIMQCKASCSDTACDAWACNVYELPRVHDGDQWLKRLLFCAMHLSWMWAPLAIIARGRHKGACNVLGLSPCGLLLACFLVWAAAFLRWVGPESRWRAPGGPFLGLLAMLGPTWALAAVVWACGSSERLEATSPLVVVLPVMVLLALLWTCGAAAAGGLLGLLGSCACCLQARRCLRRRRA